MGGQGGEVLAGLGQMAVGFAQRNAEINLRAQAQRKQQEQQLAAQVGIDLAERGQFNNASKEFLSGLEKSTSKEFVAGLFDLNRTNLIERDLRQGAVDLLNAPVTEQVGVRQRPLFDFERLPPGMEEPAPPGELGLEEAEPGPSQTVPLFSQRQPTDAERFVRFQAIGPVGVGLIAGEELGQLSLGEVRARTQLQISNKTQRNIADNMIVKLAEQGRRVLPPIPSKRWIADDVPRGFFPVHLAGEVYHVQTKNDSFNFRERFNEEARKRGFMKASEVDPKSSEEIIDVLAKRDFALRETHGATAARISRDAWLENSLNHNYPGGHRYWNTQTGQRLTGAEKQRQVQDAVRQREVKLLTPEEQKNIKLLDQTIDLFNLIASQVVGIYGPGGIFENLGPEGRLQATAEGAFATFFQTDPNLVLAKRAIEGNLSTLNRTFGGQRGAETEPDTQRMRQFLTRLGFIPDTKEVGLGTLNNVRELIISRYRSTLGNQDFVPPRLVSIDDAQPDFGTFQGAPVVVNPAEVNIIEDAEEARALALMLEPQLKRNRRILKAIEDQASGKPISREALIRVINVWRKVKGLPIPSDQQSLQPIDTAPGE